MATAIRRSAVGMGAGNGAVDIGSGHVIEGSVAKNEILSGARRVASCALMACPHIGNWPNRYWPERSNALIRLANEGQAPWGT